MEIILPEQNYSLDELNTTVYTAVKGYIENIRLLKLANEKALYYGEGDKLIVPFPASNQFEFDWEWNKDLYKPKKTIKTGDDLTLELVIMLVQHVDGLVYDYSFQVLLSATKVRKSKKTNQLGYKFKSIVSVYSMSKFVARIATLPGLYAYNFLMSDSFGALHSDPSYKSKIYTYKDTQVQQNRFTYVFNSMHGFLHIPKGQVKGIEINKKSSSNIQLPKNSLMHISPIRGTSPAFASFVQKMKRN